MEINNVCYATLKFNEPWTLKNYLKVGGYKAWKKIISKKTDPEEIVAELRHQVCAEGVAPGFLPA